MQGNGTSYDHLMRQLDARLGRIEEAIDRLADELDGKHEKLNGRVHQLEQRNAEVKGGWTVLALIGTVAGTVGGIAAKWLGQ